MGPLKTDTLQQLCQRPSLFWWQHCELNSESEVRWGPMGALCFDARGERVVLSPCPTQRPTTSTLRWKFIKARLYFFSFFICSGHNHSRRSADSLRLFLAPAERSAPSPAVPAVPGGGPGGGAPRGTRQHPCRGALPAPLLPSSQTEVAFRPASSSQGRLTG